MSRFCGKLSVGKSLGKLTPKQLGDEDDIDEDVRAEAERVANGGADGEVVKASQVLVRCPTPCVFRLSTHTRSAPSLVSNLMNILCYNGEWIVLQ